MGVCRACQQLCQERLARARAQEAGSCQPPARARRGVRTPPNRGSHRLLPHPHQPLGLGIPGGQRRRREPCWSKLEGGEKGEPSALTFTAQPGGQRTLLLTSDLVPPTTPPKTCCPAWARWGLHPPSRSHPPTAELLQALREKGSPHPLCSSPIKPGDRNGRCPGLAWELPGELAARKHKSRQNNSRGAKWKEHQDPEQSGRLPGGVLLLGKVGLEHLGGSGRLYLDV